MAPKISVIVPVYNVEQYLVRCVDSILSQGIDDLEVLLIDDGSTDSSGTICDEYAAMDGRVRVIHQRNSGVGTSRNRGLDKAKGEYITFCDSDDELAPDFLLNAVNECEHYRLDVWVGTTVRVDEQGRELGKNEARQIITGYSDELTEEQLVSIFNAVSCVSAKVWKRTAIGNMRYDVGLSFGEDLMFAHRLLLGHLRILTTTRLAYYYHMMDSGLTLTVNHKKCEGMVTTYRFLYDEGKRRAYHENGAYYEAIDDRWFHDIEYVQSVILQSKQPFKERRTMLKTLISDDRLYTVAKRKGYRSVDPVLYAVKRGLRTMLR